MIKKLGMLAAVAALLLLRPCAAGACNCQSPVNAAAARAEADSVFAGRVISIVPRQANPALPRPAEDPVAVAFDVATVWKGDVRRTIVLHTVVNLMSCEGYFFAEGGEFLVFADRQADGSLGVRLCSRTSELDRAGADVAALGAGVAPAAAEPTAAPSGSAEPGEPAAAPTDSAEPAEPAAPTAAPVAAADGIPGSLAAMLALGALALLGGLAAGLALARRRGGPA